MKVSAGVSVNFNKIENIELDERQLALVKEIIEKINEVLGNEDYIKEVKILVQAERPDEKEYNAIFLVDDTVDEDKE